MNDLQSYVTAWRGTVSKLESWRALCCGRDFSRRVVTCALTLVGLPVVIVAAGPAHGDSADGRSATADTSFLAALDAAGITYTDGDKVIKAGQTMCDYVDMGRTGKALVAVLQQHNDSLTTERAKQFMAIALQVYCPDKLVQGMEDPPPEE